MTRFLIFYFLYFLLIGEVSVASENWELPRKILREALCKSCPVKDIDSRENDCNLSHCSCPPLNLKNVLDNFPYTAKSIYPPKLLCKEDNLISLSWKGKEEYAYFLEITTPRDNNITFTEVTQCSSYIVKDLKQNSTYKLRLHALSLTKRDIGQSAFIEIQTLPSNRHLQPVASLTLKSLQLVDGSYDAVVQWEPSTDMSCYYAIVWFGDEMGTYQQETIKDPLSDHELTLKKLTFVGNYTVDIMATSRDTTLESIKKTLIFETQSCLEVYASVDKCVPEQPKILSVTEHPINIVNTDLKVLFNVLVEWERANFTPTYYNVTLRNVGLPKLKKQVQITGNSTLTTFEEVELSYHYLVNLVAWSKAGASPPVYVERHIKGTRPTGMLSSSWDTVELTLVILGPIAVAIFIFTMLFINHYMAKKERSDLRCKYFQNLDQSLELVDITVAPKIIGPTDKWELPIENVTFQRILGEGAFGVVRKGYYCDPEGQLMDVAIKTLKDAPTQEELRHFHSEIEIMKSVPPHPHLVSMIGCITNSRTTFPLLVVEYCSKGDLQTLLRHVWDRLNNQILRHTYPTETNTADDREFSNKLYELELPHAMLQPKDLISFARQVVLGMEHLSKLKVLHRDLAARNVLICSDNTVKVSDFGLSRDVYQDNVYCKTGNGKLPIRWMALESISHQRYTSQSDVWSFGVLLWEIVTLGATPYPGITTKDLLVFLKSGGRMDKPSNCSLELYEIMCLCWRASPKDRPTFTDLRNKFDSLLEGISDYLNLNLMTPVPTHCFTKKKTVAVERYVDTHNV